MGDVSCATFANWYMSYNLFCRGKSAYAVPFQWISVLLLLFGDWEPMWSTRRLAIYLELAYPVSVIVHQVCKAIVVLLGPQYINLPQGEG